MSQGATTRAQIKRDQSLGRTDASTAESNIMETGVKCDSKNSKNSKNFDPEKGGIVDMNALLKHMEEMQT